MQKIQATLQITDRDARWCDIYGTPKPEPAFIAAVDTSLVIDLRSVDNGEGGVPPAYDVADFEDVASWYLAMDRDNSQQTAPVILVTTGISVEQEEPEEETSGESVQEGEGESEEEEEEETEVPFLRTLLTASIPASAQSALVTALGESQSLALRCELGGISSGGSCVFAVQFTLTARNRVYIPSAS